jgi:hypothetical protein
VATLTEAYSEEELFQMDSEALKQAEELLYQKAAIDCAKAIATRYEGTSCMKTSIHAQAADPDNIYGQFYYDEQDMIKWHKSTTRQKQLAAGSNYYNFLLEKYEEHYITYDNGVEGIRLHGEFRCPTPIARVPPPVPDLSMTKSDNTWHYHTLTTMPREYLDVAAREVNDFCPRARMNILVKDCGNVHLTKEKKGHTITLHDINQTWQKITRKLDDFIANVCGPDLRETATKYAETMYIRSIKKAITKKTANTNVRVTGRELEAIKTGPLTLKIQRKK